MSDKIDMIMSMLASKQVPIHPNNVPLASLVAQEEQASNKKGRQNVKFEDLPEVCRTLLLH